MRYYEFYDSKILLQTFIYYIIFFLLYTMIFSKMHRYNSIKGRYVGIIGMYIIIIILIIDNNMINAIL